jgi:predicted MFS family arabinose efflux permease
MSVAASVEEINAKPVARSTFLLMAVATGVTVANLYYVQPLLHLMQQDFHTTSEVAALTVTVGQVGFAAALALVVPLADVLARRKLAVGLLVLLAAAMAAAASSPSVAVLLVASAVIGLGVAAAQVIVPFAASLAEPAGRGRVVGTVMTGMLLGTLLARTVSGALADAAGWRTVYWLGTVLVAVLAVVLALRLPRDGVREKVSYPTLLASLYRVFRAEPVLRDRMLLGGLGFATFSLFWATMAFMLAGDPYRYDTRVIGLFGLAGAAGALAANLAGRYADRTTGRRPGIVFGLCVLVSFVPLAFARQSIALLIVGVVLLDIGVQGLQVTNQSTIYRLSAGRNGRITANYMVAYFVGGALGSWLGNLAYGIAGWTGVCGLGAVVAGIAVLVATRARLAIGQPTA